MPLQRLASTLPLPKEEKRHKFQFIEVGWYPRKRAYSFTIHSQTADSTGCLFVHIRRKGISPFWQQDRNSFQSQIVLFQGKESDALKQGQSLMPACMSFFSLWFDKGSLHSLERGFRSISGISYSWTLSILLWCTSSSMPAGRLWKLLLRQEIRLGHVLTPFLLFHSRSWTFNQVSSELTDQAKASPSSPWTPPQKVFLPQELIFQTVSKARL